MKLAEPSPLPSSLPNGKLGTSLHIYRQTWIAFCSEIGFQRKRKGNQNNLQSAGKSCNHSSTILQYTVALCAVDVTVDISWFL